MLGPGDRAPDFTLPDQDGRDISLSELLADGPLVLYFYPADFTPGCTKEACTIRDMHGEIAAAGMRVVGIAPQDAASHARFRAEHKLPFTLLADRDKTVIRAWGVDGPLGIGVRRATFLVGGDGVIRDAVLADIRIGRHEEFIRAVIATAAPSGNQ
ncbi:MAG TPA: peroxiredoxin [Gammaproteobacteria bacterium]|nr:peroxiredoxin [Gammaproteobacteria bacterium]